MENFFNNKKLFIKGLSFIACAYIIIKLLDNYQLFFTNFGEILSVLSPFIIAFVFAYIFNPAMVFLERKFSLKRGLSLSIVYLGFLFLCFLMVSVIWPIVYQSAADLVKQIPGFATEVQTWINGWSDHFAEFDLGEFNDFKTQLLNFIPKLTEILTSSIGSIASATYVAIMGTGNALLGFAISIYILLEKESFLTLTQKVITIIFKPSLTQKINKTARLLHTNIGKYLIGKSLDSIFVGVCATIGLAVVGAKYSVLLGLIFGITNMVPFIGPIVGTIIATGINLFYNPIVALIIFIYLLIIQQIETLVIDPKVVGQKIGLNPFFTLLAVTLGGKFMGVPGMVLGVPIMGVLKLYFTNIVNHYYAELNPQQVSPSTEIITED